MKTEQNICSYLISHKSSISIALYFVSSPAPTTIANNLFLSSTPNTARVEIIFFVYVCVCVCEKSIVRASASCVFGLDEKINTHTHTGNFLMRCY